MMPTVLTYDHPDAAAAVNMALEIGQTLIFPTDTVYGMGGNPWDERTLNHVCRLKHRDPDQPFALLLHHVSAIATYAQCTPAVANIIEKLLPGPYTFLLPARPEAPRSTVLDGKIGVRVPNHPFFGSVLTRPVFATSVNLHDRPPINDVSEIIENFTEVDLIITGDVVGEASAVVDLTASPYRLVRGTLTEEARRLLNQE